MAIYHDLCRVGVWNHIIWKLIVIECARGNFYKFGRGAKVWDISTKFKVAGIKKLVQTVHTNLARNNRSVTLGLRFTGGDLCIKTPHY